MIEIAQRRDCSDNFSDVYTFDVCIFRLQPYFDQLTLSDKKEVALNFVIYGKLQTGSLTIFLELINPCQKYIVGYLKDISNNQLQKDFSMRSWQISAYRARVEEYSRYNLSRGSQGTGWSALENCETKQLM